jgi:hypothetical protein
MPYLREAGSISILPRRYSCGALLVQRRKAWRKAAASLNPNAYATSSIVRSVSRTYLIAACALNINSSISSRNDVPSCSSFRRKVRGLILRRSATSSKLVGRLKRLRKISRTLPATPVFSFNSLGKLVAELQHLGIGHLISTIGWGIQPIEVE